MFTWLKLAVLTAIISISKAHHLIKIIILAGLGLAGLWMIHTLAQDYHKISGHRSDDVRLLNKRSANSNYYYYYQQVDTSTAPPQMSTWLKLAVLAAIISISKAHHLIKIIILAGLGLAGLWMIHTLAQDYHKISGHRSDDVRLLNKRSANSNYYYYYQQVDTSTAPPQKPFIDWERILSRDPASCARSFICQLSAQSATKLGADEINILQLIRLSSQNENWASKEILSALKNGEQANDPSDCRKQYKYCPYTSKMMMNLLHYFGGR